MGAGAERARSLGWVPRQPTGSGRAHGPRPRPECGTLAGARWPHRNDPGAPCTECAAAESEAGRRHHSHRVEAVRFHSPKLSPRELAGVHEPACGWDRREVCESRGLGPQGMSKAMARLRTKLARTTAGLSGPPGRRGPSTLLSWPWTSPTGCPAASVGAAGRSRRTGTGAEGTAPWGRRGGLGHGWGPGSLPEWVPEMVARAAPAGSRTPWPTPRPDRDGQRNSCPRTAPSGNSAVWMLE